MTSRTRAFKSARGHVTLLREGLESVFLDAVKHACSFPAYRRHFKRCGLVHIPDNPAEVPAVLDRLLPLGKMDFLPVRKDTLRALRGEMFWTDWSSGSTARPLLRFTSAEDNAAEALASRRAFDLLGVAPADRVVCYDVGASDIYLFYGAILQDLGLQEVTFLKATSDPTERMQVLQALAPSILITVPSVLKQAHAALAEARRRNPTWKLEKIIYIGEPMDASLEQLLLREAGATCYSFYGTTEVGSVGTECLEKCGIHVPSDLFVPTLVPQEEPANFRTDVGQTDFRGVIAWTCLRFRDQPVVMYCSNDLVDMTTSQCPCGDDSPRMTFNNRIDHTFSLFGITYTYDLFLDVLQRALDRPTHLEIRCEQIRGNGRGGVSERLTFVVPHREEAQKECFRRALASIHPFEDFMERGLLEIVVECFPDDYFHRRKTRRVQRSGPSGLKAQQPRWSPSSLQGGKDGD